VFDSSASGQFDIFVIDAEGGKPKNLTKAPSMDFAPTWSHDGRWIYFTSDRSGGLPQVWRMPASGTAMQVTRNGAWCARESQDGKSLFYAKTWSIGGIWKMPLNGGEETQIVPEDLDNPCAFEVARNGLYLPKRGATGSSIHFYDFATGKPRVVATFDKSFLCPFGHLALSPDERNLVYTQVHHAGSDLVLVENFW
jgi:Tol biopolymer transport system component